MKVVGDVLVGRELDVEILVQGASNSGRPTSSITHVDEVVQ
jgi:hypothetical protein